MIKRLLFFTYLMIMVSFCGIFTRHGSAALTDEYEMAISRFNEILNGRSSITILFAKRDYGTEVIYRVDIKSFDKFIESSCKIILDNTNMTLLKSLFQKHNTSGIVANPDLFWKISFLENDGNALSTFYMGRTYDNKNYIVVIFKNALVPISNKFGELIESLADRAGCDKN